MPVSCATASSALKLNHRHGVILLRVSIPSPFRPTRLVTQKPTFRSQRRRSRMSGTTTGCYGPSASLRSSLRARVDGTVCDRLAILTIAAQDVCSALLTKLGRHGDYVTRNPLRERDLLGNVLSRCRMTLVNLCQARVRKPIRQSHQSRPQPTMNVRDLAVDEPADEYVRAIPHRARSGEYLAPPRMCPPAATNRPARDRTG
jgi:hypothetical protein